jgi:hypothetical protein
MPSAIGATFKAIGRAAWGMTNEVLFSAHERAGMARIRTLAARKLALQDDLLRAVKAGAGPNVIKPLEDRIRKLSMAQAARRGILLRNAMNPKMVGWPRVIGRGVGVAMLGESLWRMHQGRRPWEDAEGFYNVPGIPFI